ncbi:hypothetical protein GGR56DRAFT_665722 [Xylariaceae sp. FL0804]|nr:hypothetical protein GGR56DRAFT_665722 [Xylariaceae sp. FL0804]
MRPLIVHNVPDEELYTGEDGVQRPYGIIFPDGDRQRSAPRTRAREINETGSFGKSTRRSRSRTGSLAPRREDATMQSADKIFSSYVNSRQQAQDSASPSSQRRSSYLPQTAPQAQDDPAAAATASALQREPVEIVLRGYASASQQYAAINHYEQLAGRICEDYSREPPIEACRYKSDLRDPALTRRQPLSSAERKKVNRAASGEHWIKVTFESREAAGAAMFASPQKIMGHLVYAEPYRGLPPLEDNAVLDVMGDVGMLAGPVRSSSIHARRRRPSQPRAGEAGTLPGSLATTPAAGRVGPLSGSPPESQTSTQTLDSATASGASLATTASTATVMGALAAVDSHMEGTKEASGPGGEGAYSRRVPGARRVKLLSPNLAVKKRPSWTEYLLAMIPLLGWFSGAMIGNQVPRNELGEFDRDRASLYWKVMYFLDSWFSLFGRELVTGDRDD